MKSLTYPLFSASTPIAAGFIRASDRGAISKSAGTELSAVFTESQVCGDFREFLRWARKWSAYLPNRCTSESQKTMLRTFTLAFSLALACTAASAAFTLGSKHAIVVDEETGEVLLQKDAMTPTPMASLTKLMTAMVVLDAEQDPNEGIRIVGADLDRPRHTRGGVPVGAVIARGALLELTLIASDNHAASALARGYPGGIDAFHTAIKRKIHTLGLRSTVIEEPTGLSENNLASAQDMIKILRAAASYPVIAQITSKRNQLVTVSGRPWAARNTNRLVGSPSWNILLSKTGFTNEAGRCLSMRITVGGRTAMVVLLGAASSSERARDALSIRGWLAGEAPVAPGAEGAHLRVATPRKRGDIVDPRRGHAMSIAIQQRGSDRRAGPRRAKAS